MASPNSGNAQHVTPCDIQCLQGNMWQSKACLLSLLVDVNNKNIYPKGVDIIFITEPPTVTSTNKLSNVPNDIYKAGR